MLNTVAVVISTVEVRHKKIAWEKTVHPVGSDCNYSVGSDFYNSSPWGKVGLDGMVKKLKKDLLFTIIVLS